VPQAQIGAPKAIIDEKTVNLRKKGGIPWEIKAGKKTKTKLRNKKPTNKRKKKKRNSRDAFFEGNGGLRLSEAHHSC